MTDYNLYKSSDLVTPFIVVPANVINSSSTSVNFVGQAKLSYGQPMQQSTMWMLEHFANTTAPTNPMKGQAWYDTSVNLLKVCINNVGPVWEIVGKPKAQTSAPSSPVDGQLWWDNNTGVKSIKVYDAGLAAWSVVGPYAPAVQAYQFETLYTGVTSNNTQTEIFVNGNAGSRNVIPNNASWGFEVILTARRIDGGADNAFFKVSGMIEQTSGTVQVIGSVGTTVLSRTSSTWSVAVDADNTNKSLRIQVTGENAKQIRWVAVSKVLQATTA